ncbi:indolepyruvate ferredoxin oxidoreductase subunit alpha, partial [bacterium]
MNKRVLLSGNEAIARGAYEAGVHFASAYPGTPSTEILENVARYYKDSIKCQWAPNEKVAVEVAIGATFGGARSMAAMKHVGVNVAADPLFTLSETGVNGGFLLVSADDPAMHSSQNEQDNRRYAKFAKMALIEPSDSQEAKDFVKTAMEISEKFDIPVLMKITTRIAHSKTVVELGERQEVPVKEYEPNIKKRVVIPAHARILHKKLEERLAELKEYTNSSSLNRIEQGEYSHNGKKIGILTSGISYQYAKEVFPDATILKLGLTFPFPDKLAKEFYDMVDEIWVIEENEPFLEEEMAIASLDDKIAIGKNKIPLCLELNQEIIREAILGEKARTPRVNLSELPARPPVLCPGCPHRGIFYVANKMKLHGTTDIGCYTLGVIPPLEQGETCICMGASIGIAHGLGIAQGPEFGKKVLGYIGDSTFIHSGMTGLINLAYNKGNAVICILDNSTTAMTGHQPHPGTGFTITGEPTFKADYAEIADALGIKNVYKTDAYNLEEIEKALKEATATEEPAVIINQGRCIL